MRSPKSAQQKNKNKGETTLARLWSPICDELGIQTPIFGFAHDVATVAAISQAGGYGVYGATRRFPHEITAEIADIRSRVGDLPFGVDLVLPPGMPEHNSREAIEAEIPQEHKDFVAELIERYKVPPAGGPGMRTRFIRSAEIEREQIDAVLNSSVNMFACGIGAPRDVVAAAKERNQTTLALIGSPHHVHRAIDAGVEVIVAQGYDAGAHTGPIGTFSLVPQIVEAAGDVPVALWQVASRPANTLPPRLLWEHRAFGLVQPGCSPRSIRSTCIPSTHKS